LPSSDLPPLPQKRTMAKLKRRLKSVMPRRRAASADGADGSVEEEGGDGSSEDLSVTRLEEIERYVGALFAIPALLQGSEAMKQFFELPSVGAAEVDAFVSKIADMSLWSDAVDWTGEMRERTPPPAMNADITPPPPTPGVDVSFV
jgi:hypothetical protein